MLLDVAKLHYFHGNYLVLVIVPTSFIDRTAEASADDVVESVAVRTDTFFECPNSRRLFRRGKLTSI